MSEKEKVEGYVEHIIFRNEENGYTVLNLSMKGRELTCVGTLPMIGEGELIEASGDYIEHAAYGKQFRIESYETKVPQDSVALERYLGSGAIKGVGAALAARIVRRFGDDTLRIIEEEPERLAEVKGISERKAREIAQQVAEKAEMQNAMIFLSGYGIALNLGAKIYQQYGDNVYRILKENPYKMAEDIAGVGFRTADEIAGKIGIAVDSEFRIKSGLSYVLNQATAEGHVYLPEPVLLRRGQELLGVEPERMHHTGHDRILMSHVPCQIHSFYIRIRPVQFLNDAPCTIFAAIIHKEHKAVGTDFFFRHQLIKQGCQTGGRIFQHFLLIIAGGYNSQFYHFSSGLFSSASFICANSE